MRDAIVAVEDKRFWTDPGVDIRGIARARGSPTSPAAATRARRRSPSSSSRTRSPRRTTARSSRSCARRRWHSSSRISGRKQQILTEYLNTIYFGNGAYGIESAARVYFGKITDTTRPSSRAAAAAAATRPRTAAVRAHAEPQQAALLAGMVANPSAFDPAAIPQAAKARRDLVLQDMLQQHYISAARSTRHGTDGRCPPRAEIQQTAGAARGAVLHELVAPADPRRAGAGGRPRTWPSTGPTTAA